MKTTFLLIVLITFSSPGNFSEDTAFGTASKMSSTFITELVESIGGMNVKEDLAVDELNLPNYNEEEMEKFRESADYEHFVQTFDEMYEEPSEWKMYDKLRRIKSQIGFHELGYLILDTELTYEIAPGILKANDLFYKIKDLNEFKGINQELRDNLVELITQAKLNIDLIHKKWNNLQKLVRARLLKPINQLEEQLEKIIEGGDELEEGREYTDEEIEEIYARIEAEEEQMSDREILETEWILDEVEENIKRVKEKDAKLRKILNTFLKEEKSLVRLGIDLWLNSQVDYTVEDERLEMEIMGNDAILEKYNELQNQEKRKLITKMNINKDPDGNVTDSSNNNLDKDQKGSKESKIKEAKPKEEL